MALTKGTNVGFVTTAPTADPAGSDTTIDGSSVVVKHTSPTGATRITEIGWYRGSGTNTSNFEIALYADSGGTAGARLYVDNTNSSSSSGWITTSVDWPINPGTPYWLGLQMDAHSGSSTVDSATSGGDGIDLMTSQSTLNDPYGGGAVSDADGMYAIYALTDVTTNDVTVRATDGANDGGTGAISKSVTAVAGLTNPAFLTWTLGYDTGTPSNGAVTSVTYGGNAFTKIAELHHADGFYLELWILYNSISGANTWAVNFTAHPASYGGAIFMQIDNAAQTGQPDSSQAERDASATTGSISVTSTADRTRMFSLAVAGSGNPFTSIGGYQTQEYLLDSFAPVTYTPIKTPAGAVAHTYTKTSDNFYMLAATIKPSTATNVTVSADRHSTTLALQAPTVTTERSSTVSPNQQTTTIALPAPTVVLATSKTVTADRQSATLTLQVPTVTSTISITVAAAQQSATLALQSPTVTATKTATLTPAQQTTTLALQAPTVTATKSVTVVADTVSLAVALQAATVSTATNATVTPAQQTTTLALQAPAISTTKSVTVAAGVVTGTLALQTPTITATKSVTVSAGVVTGTFALQAPTISTTKSVTVSADLPTTTLALQVPTVTATKTATVTPGQIAQTITLQAPTVSATKSVTVAADVASGTIALQTPIVSVGGSVTVTPAQIATTLTLQTPTVTAAKNITVSADSVSLTGSLQALTVSATKSAMITADYVSLTGSLQTPTITTTRNITVLSDMVTMNGTAQTATATTSGNAASVTVQMPVLYLGGQRAHKLILVDGNLAYKVGGIYHMGI